MTAARRRELLHRQRGELGEGHGLVVPLVVASAAWVLALDAGVASEFRRRIDRDRAVIAAPQPNKRHGGSQGRLQSHRRVGGRGVHEIYSVPVGRSSRSCTRNSTAGRKASLARNW